MRDVTMHACLHACTPLWAATNVLASAFCEVYNPVLLIVLGRTVHLDI